ncbi:MAG TPA: YggT family protein [Patescibacteria group bacterium]|nr:YggT family protein [Patescibacteria group bacterium]
MTETVRETVTTRDDSPATSVKAGATGTQTVQRLVYFLFGILEILLAFRLIFKLAGASYGGAFVGFIYSVTRIFILPFGGIFRQATAPGAETAAILEPATLVAIIVYAVLAWGIVALVKILSGEQQTD